MKVYVVLLIFLTNTFIKVAECKGYYDCSDDDCSFYDSPNDPTNPYMDLWLNVEQGINDTLGLPSWKMGLEFYNGYLAISNYDFDMECACPVILKGDKAFVTIHAYDILDLWYSYKFPISEDKDGAMQITCEYTFSALLVNETGRSPIFQKVEVTSLNLINVNPYGVPLKWIDNLPEKYFNLLKDALYSPVKRLLEVTLLKTFNEILIRKYSTTQLHGILDNSVL